MGRNRHKLRKQKVGLPPGSLNYLGEQQQTVSAQLFVFDEFAYKEDKRIEPPFGFEPANNAEQVHWLNLHGISDTLLLEDLGDHFGIHRMTLEDILDTTQRPKLEESGSYLFITLKSLVLMPDKTIGIEQFSFVLFQNLLISFQERKFDIFEKIRTRIREKSGMIRYRQADYLLYLLLDAVVDHYLIITSYLEERIDQMESDLISNPDAISIQEIEHIKKELIYCRSAVLPFKEVAQNLEKGIFLFPDHSYSRYFGDLKDNTLDTLDALDTCRQLADGVMNLRLSYQSNRLNEVMKVLTIISTIFIPLTFVTGIYGMNFRYMPELEWLYGYPAILISCLSISVLMLFYFKKKKWI